MRETTSDPVIEEVREARHRISASCGHDAERLIAYYMKLQEQFRERLIESPKAEGRTDESAA